MRPVGLHERRRLPQWGNLQCERCGMHVPTGLCRPHMLHLFGRLCRRERCVSAIGRPECKLAAVLRDRRRRQAGCLLQLRCLTAQPCCTPASSPQLILSSITTIPFLPSRLSRPNLCRLSCAGAHKSKEPQESRSGTSTRSIVTRRTCKGLVQWSPFIIIVLGGRRGGEQWRRLLRGVTRGRSNTGQGGAVLRWRPAGRVRHLRRQCNCR